MPREADGEIEQRLIFDDPAGLDAAARGQHDLRLGVVDAGRQLLGGEAAEHHPMHGPDARAGDGEHDIHAAFDVELATGAAPVTISFGNNGWNRLSVSGATFPMTLNPGQSVTLNVQFEPTVTGAASAS